MLLLSIILAFKAEHRCCFVPVSAEGLWDWGGVGLEAMGTG